MKHLANAIEFAAILAFIAWLIHEYPPIVPLALNGVGAIVPWILWPCLGVLVVCVIVALFILL